jgi:hypothetical protein
MPLKKEKNGNTKWWEYEGKNGIKQCHSSTEALKTTERQWTIQKHWRDKTEVRQQRHGMKEGLGLKYAIK